ncbi:sulfatase [Coraliomargarita sp. SDUM461004]|uniref:Sulfatase n=1 Tax=Thalassobacterium sedimentorum TaxID=3041258 RepID=A0ABU1AGQ3_9BACT|nr:sulfatase [Coraliomargarita sp. SDUM461004]MDQ8193030.1 sulfatase [Coraliomargarita sp. SDUM461004]
MNTPQNLLILIITLLLCLSPCLSEADQPDAKKNVLFVIVDDLRPVLGSYGDPIAETPAMDRLAKSSMRFDNAYCQVAMCGPSRASLISGLRPTTTGYVKHGKSLNHYIPDDYTTLPKQFTHSGYITKPIGKIHHNHSGDSRPGDWTEAWYNGQVNNALSPYRVYADPANIEKNKTTRGELIEIKDADDSQYGTYALAEDAINSIQLYEKDARPFFIALGFYRPHVPWIAPQHYYDLYNTEEKNRLIDQTYLTKPNGKPFDAKTELPKGVGIYADNYMNQKQYEGTPEGGCDGLDMEGARHWIRAYYASVSLVDAQLGRVIDYLEANDLMKETIIVVTSDHGYHLADHGNIWAKQTAFRDAARIPLLIHAPELTHQHSATDAPVELIDIYPTLVDLAGIEPPAQPNGLRLEGKSLRPLLEQPNAPWKEAAFHIWLSPVGSKYYLESSMTTRRYRYSEAWTVNGKGNDIMGSFGVDASDPDLYLEDAPYNRELYDHWEDPKEHRNLIHNLSNAPENAALNSLVDAYHHTLNKHHGWKAYHLNFDL